MKYKIKISTLLLLFLKMEALLVFLFVALSICAINISIYRLINEVGPKIKVDDVGFVCRPKLSYFVSTLLFYVVTYQSLSFFVGYVVAFIAI